MDAQGIPLKTTARRFVSTVGVFARSEAGPRAKIIFGALVVLLLAANALNVANSFVGRNFMTAIADRDMSGFIRQAFIYVGVFAALTVVAVISRFGEERLGLLWRDTMTRGIVRLYLADGNYHRLAASETLANPDQRISEDVRAFTVTTLSFTLMGLNSIFTIVAFSEVLWTISPLLFGVAVAYAAGGSFFTFALGRPLIKLNYDQLDKEASFRSELIGVRDNSEAILQARDEEQQTTRLLSRLDDVVANFRKITSINRNVGFFTTGYNWLIQIIPALIIAPAFIAGKIEFGVITQSAIAFTTLVAAFSLIVTQFQSLSNFAAVVARLSALAEAVGQTDTLPGGEAAPNP
jgi:putative ATP-binding cassette transporter